MAKKKVKPTRYIGPIFILGSILLVGTIYFYNRSQVQDIRSSALFEDDPNFCQNHCPVNGATCDLNNPAPNGDPNVNDPCCQEIARTGDPGACAWPQRGYCTIDQCAAIPEGVNRQRCGGPRHSWCGECQSHNCPGYGNITQPTSIPPTAVPIIPTEVIIQPTQFVLPTEIPTIYVIPTSVPLIPTQIIQNPRNQVTYVPVQYPTNPPPVPPTSVPTKIPNILSLPNLLPVKEKIEVFIQKTKFSILDFLSKILP